MDRENTFSSNAAKSKGEQRNAETLSKMHQDTITWNGRHSQAAEENTQSITDVSPIEQPVAGGLNVLLLDLIELI